MTRRPVLGCVAHAIDAPVVDVREVRRLSHDHELHAVAGDWSLCVSAMLVHGLGFRVSAMSVSA